MVDYGVVEDRQIIDWDNLLDNLPDDLNFDFFDEPVANGFSTSPDSGFSLSIDDIEQYLLSDDSNNQGEKDQNVIVDGFLSDVLLDSSPGSGSDHSKGSSSSPELVEAEAEADEEDKQDKQDARPYEKGADVPQTKENNVVDVEDDDDPVAKKRKRQMRNRDAAVRSRERKKMHVRDLEMKGKYYEAECRRLGNLLQCCLAENQALRLSMHNSKAFGASMTKQESAVLLLESLLLGSLLGFMGIIYLLILPTQLLLTLEAGLVLTVDSVKRGSVAPGKVGSEVYRVLLFHSFMMGKRCKASRSRMKLRWLSSTQVIV